MVGVMKDGHADSGGMMGPSWALERIWYAEAVWESVIQRRRGETDKSLGYLG